MDISIALMELSKPNLLKFITPHDIYNHYLDGKLIYNRSFSSPFRQDKNPSFVINKSSLYYRDFATGDNGDCFSFVKKMYNIDFYSALKQIAFDLNISDKFVIIDNTFQTSKTLTVENVSRRGTYHGDFNLKVKTRKFQQYDLDYWNSFGVSIKYLKLGNVFAISHYFVNEKQFIAEKYAYVYVEIKDGVETYKVYQPFSNNMKWINGNNYSVWELWTLMPKKHESLILTSSRKDALSIIENCKIPSTSFQAESINPKIHVVESVLDRFENVYLLYDNDYDKEENWGQLHAKKRLEQFEFINLIIPKFYRSKDFSDLVYNHGRVKAVLILKTLIDEQNIRIRTEHELFQDAG